MTSSRAGVIRGPGARAIVAGPGTRTALARFVTQVVRRPPLRTGGVLLWRHLAGR